MAAVKSQNRFISKHQRGGISSSKPMMSTDEFDTIIDSLAAPSLPVVGAPTVLQCRSNLHCKVAYFSMHLNRSLSVRSNLYTVLEDFRPASTYARDELRSLASGVAIEDLYYTATRWVVSTQYISITRKDRFFDICKEIGLDIQVKMPLLDGCFLCLTDLMYLAHPGVMCVDLFPFPNDDKMIQEVVQSEKVKSLASLPKSFPHYPMEISQHLLTCFLSGIDFHTRDDVVPRHAERRMYVLWALLQHFGLTWDLVVPVKKSSDGRWVQLSLNQWNQYNTFHRHRRLVRPFGVFPSVNTTAESFESNSRLALDMDSCLDFIRYDPSDDSFKGKVREASIPVEASEQQQQQQSASAAEPNAGAENSPAQRCVQLIELYITVVADIPNFGSAAELVNDLWLLTNCIMQNKLSAREEITGPLPPGVANMLAISKNRLNQTPTPTLMNIVYGWYDLFRSRTCRENDLGMMMPKIFMFFCQLVKRELYMIMAETSYSLLAGQFPGTSAADLRKEMDAKRLQMMRSFASDLVKCIAYSDIHEVERLTSESMYLFTTPPYTDCNFFRESFYNQYIVQNLKHVIKQIHTYYSTRRS